MSRSAVTEKSPSWLGSKSPGPMLPCGAARAIEWRRSCGGGHAAQARRRHDAREASVGEEKQPSHERRCSPPPCFSRRHCPVIGHGRVFSALHPVGLFHGSAVLSGGHGVKEHG
jgi:hypothetical protein